jgi:hypothetical protein
MYLFSSSHSEAATLSPILAISSNPSTSHLHHFRMSTPTKTVSLAAVFLPSIGQDPDSVADLWAERTADFTWLTILSTFGGVKRNYTPHLQSWLQTTVEVLGSEDNDPAERAKTMLAITTPCFTDEDIVELCHMCDEPSVGEDGTDEGDSSIATFIHDLQTDNTEQEQKEVTQDLEESAREFFQDLPVLSSREFANPFTWETAYSKMEDAKSALEALKQLKTLGDSESEVTANLREMTTNLAEHYPLALGITDGSASP